MTTIYAATNDQVLVATILPKIARNNINMVRLYVAFDSTWDDINARSAVFYTSKNARPYEVLLSDGYCLIPQEVLAEEAKLHITVKGVLSTGAVKTSTKLTVKVLDGTPVVIISDPAPSIYQQLLTASEVLKARFDIFASLKEGSTTGDAELQDIRVGANGKTYVSAGEAIREQTNDLLNLIAGSVQFVPLEKENSLLKKMADCFVGKSGTLTAQAGYTVAYFKAANTFNCYVEAPQYEYLSLSVFDGDLGTTFVQRLVGSELPTEETQLLIKAGQTVAFSYTTADFRLHHNSQYLGYKTSDAFHLSEKALADIHRLSSNLTNPTAFNAITPASKLFTCVDGYVGSDGNLTVYDTYKTYYMKVDNDCSCYFAPFTGQYLSIAIYYDNFERGYIGRYRKTEDNLPYAENPIELKAGYTIAISTTGEDFALYGNNNVFAKELADDVVLNEFHKQQIVKMIAKKPVLKYSSIGNGDYSTEIVNIYIPTVIGYVKYEFAHVVEETINANSWRIKGAFACDDNFSERFPITTHGEWEMAIRINGRNDFIGGSLHGDEVVNNILFIVDGVKKSFDEMKTATEFETLRIVENTNMYDPADSTTKVATHGKEYIFSEKGLTLKQSVNWLKSCLITTSYMTMLPIKRKNGDLQITDRYYCDYDFAEKDVSTTEHKEGVWKKGVRNATIYSDKSGVCASVEILEAPNALGGGWFFVSDAEQYNKLYFVCAGYNGVNHTTVDGERWGAETKYTITVNDSVEI